MFRTLVDLHSFQLALFSPILKVAVVFVFSSVSTGEDVRRTDRSALLHIMRVDDLQLLSSPKKVVYLIYFFFLQYFAFAWLAD